MEYAELHARSACSFLRGASHPAALAARAAELGLPAVALCDRDGVYGSARFYSGAKEHGIRAIVGAELTMDDGSVLPVLVESRTGYRNLCQLITRAKLSGTKEEAPARWDDLAEFSAGLVALTGDEEGPLRRALARDDRLGASACVSRLVSAFGKESVFVEIQRHLRRGEERESDALRDIASASGLPLLATNGVLHATRDERAVLDVFTCARNHTHLDVAGETAPRPIRARGISSPCRATFSHVLSENRAGFPKDAGLLHRCRRVPPESRPRGSFGVN